jgi:hypothetical protein
MIDPALATLIGVGSIAVFFMVAAVAPTRKARVEVGSAPLYQERCSLTVSSIAGMRFGGNLPLWRVSLYESFLVVSLFRQRVIRYDEISSVSEARGVVSRALELRVRTPPETIRIFAKRPEKMIEIIRGRDRAA